MYRCPAEIRVVDEGGGRFVFICWDWGVMVEEDEMGVLAVDESRDEGVFMEETSVKGFMSIRRLRHGSELVLIEWLWVLEGR